MAIYYNLERHVDILISSGMIAVDYPVLIILAEPSRCLFNGGSAEKQTNLEN